jgi:hypothetical protein
MLSIERNGPSATYGRRLIRQRAGNLKKHAKQSRYHSLRWILAGLALVGALGGVCFLSFSFEHGLKTIDKPIVPFVLVMAFAGTIYLLALRTPGALRNRWLLGWIFAIGLVARLLMFSTPPILEDDHYRYLWDGGVVANGFNPYRFAPKAFLRPSETIVPSELKHLANEAGTILQNVNYPELRTIYPPLAQGVFGLAHLMSPWRLWPWRMILLVIDIATLILLAFILFKLSFPMKGLVVYWWNPLLIKEIYNSGHMDILLFPFLLATFLFTSRKMYLRALGFLGIASGIKLWPVLLLPIVLRPLWRQPRRMLLGLCVFIGISAIGLFPLLSSGLGKHSGLSAYAAYWQMNDALYMAVFWAISTMATLSNDLLFTHLLARSVVVCILVVVIFRMIRKDPGDNLTLAGRFLFPTAVLFFLSPTQFPWYYLWLLPFLALRTSFALLLLTALMPIYYLRFYFEARQATDIFDDWIVWLQYGPAWFLLIYKALQSNSWRDAKGLSPKIS